MSPNMRDRSTCGLQPRRVGSGGGDAADSRMYIMAGGGTGGHVIPAIAVAREVCRMGYRVLFVGTERGVENKLVPAAGFRLEKIRVG